MLHPLSLPAKHDVERLIGPDTPARPRAVAVLDGQLTGRAWADDPDEPRAVLVLEDADGTVYGGGALTPAAVAAALDGVRTASGDLIFGFSGPGDPIRSMMPTVPYWRGEAVDFTDRVPPEDDLAMSAPRLPEGVRVVRLDGSLLPLTEWYEDTLHAFGSVERWEALAVGFAVMAGDRMLAEALAGPRCRGMLEMGVVTREDQRRRGYGTLVSRLTARACEAEGDRVWWNANASNAPSVAIARRIGFTRERRYELVACHASRS
ncbi:MAG TPA: GNAT family N-acetyltransferase [Candidatus Limnocylindria bacterium]|nr:GNAT family N-acetyltransferase [Candidatus Limnocylindria bacterium]